MISRLSFLPLLSKDTKQHESVKIGPYADTHKEYVLDLLDRSENFTETLEYRYALSKDCYLSYISEVFNILPDKNFNVNDFTITSLKNHCHELMDAVNCTSNIKSVPNYKCVRNFIDMYSDEIWDNPITYRILHDLLRLYYHELKYKDCTSSGT